MKEHSFTWKSLSDQMMQVEWSWSGYWEPGGMGEGYTWRTDGGLGQLMSWPERRGEERRCW